MAWRAVTDTQWERIRPISLVRDATPGEGVRAPTPADASRASCGSSGPAHLGASYRGGTAAPPPAGAASGRGSRLGVLLAPWRAFLNEPNDPQKIRWNECFVDGSFAPAKKGPPKIGKTKRGKGTK